MLQTTNQLMFALLRSVINDVLLSDAEKPEISDEMMESLYDVSSKHDIAHLVGVGLEKNGLIGNGKTSADIFSKEIVMAAYRYEQQNYEFERVCDSLERARISFMPLKGSIMRRYYAEPWYRTSCDIDILVHNEDVDKAISVLVEDYGYTAGVKGGHDVSLFTPGRVHVELHYDLIEDGRVTAVYNVLQTVWDNAIVRDGYKYLYEMTDEMFYFYHIAHMAKHFTVGGCGVKPFIDLWILERINDGNKSARMELLEAGDLQRFGEIVCNLSKAWFGTGTVDEILTETENYILPGGVFGTTASHAAATKRTKGAKIKYIIQTIFLPYDYMRKIYPVLEKHKWLLPFMEIHRWIKKGFTKSGKQGRAAAKTILNVDTKASNNFFEQIGL